MGNRYSKVNPSLDTEYEFTAKIIKIEPYNILPINQMTQCHMTLTKKGIHFSESRDNNQTNSSIKTYSLQWENVLQYSYQHTLFNFRFKTFKEEIKTGELFIQVSDFNTFLRKFRKYYQSKFTN